jgi:hypothetical protein
MKVERLAFALVALALLVLVGVLLDRPAGAEEGIPAVLRAQRMELVDSRGVTRASLRVEPDGQVVFRLMDEHGTIRVKLGANEAGSGLALLNEKTEVGVHLLATRARTFMAIQRGKQRRVLRP